MSLNYEKARQSSAEHSNVWSSYSDLFMVLSLVFLLLYVVAGLRTSTHGLRNNLAYKTLQYEANDLREQIQVYNTLKESYLENSAEAGEEEIYEQLMSRLTLLKDDAEEEKLQLEEQADENAEKAMALNRYQQIVRNMINTNVLAKAGLQSRDKIIAEKSQALQLKEQVLDLQKTAMAKQVELIEVKETQLASQEQQLTEKQELIQENETQLQAKRNEIESLKRSVSARESKIDRNNDEISAISIRLESQKKQLDRQKQQQELSDANYVAEVAELEKASANQIDALRNENQGVKASLSATEQRLTQAGEKLTSATSKLNKQQEEKQDLERSLQQAKTSLVTANSAFADDVSKLKGEFQARLAVETRQFAEELNGLEMTLAERRAEEAAFKADALRQERDLNLTIAQLSSKAELDAAQTNALKADHEGLQKKIAAVKKQFDRETMQMEAEFDAAMKAKSRAFATQLDKQELGVNQKLEEERKFREAAVADTKSLMSKLDKLGRRLQSSENRLSVAKKDRDDHKNFVAALQAQNKTLSTDLATSHKAMKTKKQIIGQLQDSFSKAGIDADIDPESGEMILSFGDEYFDTDSDSLTRGMSQTLKDHIPTYARSLFMRPEVAENLASVEIVGFSSPTYQGKYVDPSSLDEGARAAVNYNLDLSYRRARSIFQYIFNTDSMSFQHQPELLRLIKVTGRSFLSEDLKGRTLEKGLSRRDFCKQYDCLKSQRVLIKFNIKD